MNKYALISVSDKTGIIELAKNLTKHNYKILSTGGSAKHIRENGIDVTDVSEYTGFPEMMDGRVKTLHPKVHGGILARRDISEHCKAAEENGISFIDMVIINLYPFEETINKEGVSLEETIENIDIGGPAMVRSASKNYQDVTVVVSPSFYTEIIQELDANSGKTTLELRKKLAVAAFQQTAFYDSIISNHLSQVVLGENSLNHTRVTTIPLRYREKMRYGENPHQLSSFFSNPLEKGGITHAKQLHGKELSFNNIYDVDAAYNLACEFEKPAVAVIKHTNPCGCATADTIEEAYTNAYNTDTISAFGGVYAINRELSLAIAEELAKIFVEVVVAPSYSEDALKLLMEKKNIRLLTADFNKNALPAVNGKFVSGGMLLQDNDIPVYDESTWKIVTDIKPTEKEINDLKFAFTVVKHVKSNAIVYARNGKTIGIGAGQMSRVDSVNIANSKKCEPTEGAMMASDAFFPFRDAVDNAAKAGIKAIIQPGGSIKDQDIIDAANELGIAMVFTGMRHFRH
ncbi:MAG: bifunctional phosphoribosylaminoimidazolecarboxamide formyltransferase/IMP cyclohydrolase [Nitrospinae bacterium]|nr:bifunctional phosphoribosylaminoimidazolecarboxamide formyltransferase/IMP cyclohydrolase [Nitrospinota bacterium]